MRDGSGNPTGIPGSAAGQIKRVTANEYWVTTPDAADTTTVNTSVYNRSTAPPLRNALKVAEVRSGLTSGTLARTEYTYQGPTTIGNVTEEKIWDSRKGRSFTDPDNPSSPLGPTNSVSIVHQYGSWPQGTYDPVAPTGKHTQTTDANNHVTTYSYGDIGNGTTNLYPDKIEVASDVPGIKRTTSFKYDFNTGLVTETKDVDNNVTAITSYDFFSRPTQVREAAGTALERKTITEYGDVARRVIVKADKDTASDGKMISVQHYDQLYRVRLTRTLESGLAADATNENLGIKVQTRYRFDGANSYALTSAPYRATTSGQATGEQGMGWSLAKHDRLGRVVELKTYAGTALPAPWGNSTAVSGTVTTSYDAEVTTVTDQASKPRRSLVDGLGRLIRVDEPYSTDANPNNVDMGTVASPLQPTAYTYDARGNLLTVSQTGIPAGQTTPVTQTRTFVYTSRSQLFSATNPESGTVKYAYDNNGNLTAKLDARGITTTYQYDALNRNTWTTYSTYPNYSYNVERRYDGAGIPFSKGRLTTEIAYAFGSPNTALKGPGGESYTTNEIVSYDALGRPLSSSQKFLIYPSGQPVYQPYTVSRTYDLAGHVKTQTYPSNRQVSYSYDNVGRLTDFRGKLGGTASDLVYATSPVYGPGSQMLREQFGTNTPLYLRKHYNARGQLYDIRLGTDGSATLDSDDPNLWQFVSGSWNRGALRLYYTDNAQVGNNGNWSKANGNLYRLDHFVPTTLDGSGNITAWSMSIHDYQYDSLNRVKRVTETTGCSGTGCFSTFVQAYKYDRFGNRLIDVPNTTAGINGVTRLDYKINGAKNRLLAPSDVSGDQTPTLAKLSNTIYDNVRNLRHCRSK